MCGLAGILNRSPLQPTRDELARMGDRIAHRGPDAFGWWSAPHVGLAHRRLSIIDLAGGDQPIGNEDQSIQVVFNGEIYNYPALRDQLIGRGHQLRTHSDTEVLVHLYEDHGARLVDHLRGMFAFALWDSRRRRLLLARDRLGQKPLYVYRDEARWIFASEIKAILALEGVDVTLDPYALDAYLTYGCIPGSLSIFKEIRKLPPAHTLTISLDDGAEDLQRYWSLDFQPDESTSVDDWKSQLVEKVDETIAAHMIADVPVGAFLSGGLDSSLIVATMSRVAGFQPKTFSIGFEEEQFSELPHARVVARAFGTEHIEHIVTAEAVQSLEDLVHYYDEPFADSSAIPSMAIARLAAEHVKVVLSGDGGDEAFGGYARYQHDLREARIRNRLPRVARNYLLRPLGERWPKADRWPRPLRLKTALQNLAFDPPDAYANTLAIIRQATRGKLLHPAIAGRVVDTPAERMAADHFRTSNGDALRGMLAVDTALLLPDDFLTKVDRASMAFGLEVRPPFVDHELMELCARIPSRFKIRDGQTKWILREALGHRLPPELLTLPKRGFEIPIDQWIRGPLRDAFMDLTMGPNSPVNGIIDARTTEQLFRAHERGHGRHGNQLWAIMVLGRWLAEYKPRGVAA